VLSEAFWRLSEASVRGKGHIDHGMPNQDSVAVRTNASGQVVAAAVSDGAGTALKSGDGSRATADFMADWLLRIGEDLSVARLTEDMIEEKLAAGIDMLRSRLAAQGESLRDFHCTLAGCVLTAREGLVCQLGDSIAVATKFAELAGAPPRIDFFPDGGSRVYEVERGEYSNETHFITEPDWRSHLRVAFLPPSPDAVILMSDGAMDLAVRERRVFRGFLSTLLARLLTLQERDGRNAAIEEWLSDPKSFPLTSDDKTIFVAIRQALRLAPDRAVYIEDTDSAAPAPSPPAISSAAADPVPAVAVRAPSRIVQSWRSLALLLAVLAISVGLNVYLMFVAEQADMQPVALPVAQVVHKEAAKPAAAAIQHAPAPADAPVEAPATAPAPVAVAAAEAAKPAPAVEAPKAEPAAAAEPDGPALLGDRPVVALEGKPLKPVKGMQGRKEMQLTPGQTEAVTLRLRKGAYAAIHVEKESGAKDAGGVSILRGRGSCYPNAELQAAPGTATCVMRVRAEKGASSTGGIFTIWITTENHRDSQELAVDIVRPAAKKPPAGRKGQG
jgi:hypothetical protein